jgi:hypothetical protein
MPSQRMVIESSLWLEQRRRTVHGRLPAHRFEARPVEKGPAQWMTDKRLIQTGWKAQRRENAR